MTGAGDGTCFAACPDPTDTRSNCFADCFYASMFSGRVQRSDLLAAWNKAFAGSCPSLPPPPLATAAATALAATPISVATPTSTLAAISIMATLGDGLSLGIGTMKKSPHNPLFGQDTPWEPRLDNGYPNIVPPAPGVKDGAKEEPKGREASWQLWYGDCIQGCNSQIVLYANSTDGITWEKPSLNLFDVSTVRPDLKHIGKANNIVMKGGGVGVFRDDHEQDLARRYKALGEACYLRQGDGGDDDTNTTTSVGVSDGDGGTDTLVDIENITGSGFNDVLIGDTGANVLTGGDGNDRLDGGGGADRLVGGNGNDIYTVDSADDVVVELAGGGLDRINASWNCTLPENVEYLVGKFCFDWALELKGSSGSDRIIGTNRPGFADTLWGNDGSDVLHGLVGNDTLYGGAGNDRIFGQSGDDTIIGGTGQDRMTGQFGEDTFVFDFGDGRDRITDFDDRGDDLLDLSALSTDFSTVENQMTQQGLHVLIDFNNGDTILLERTNLASITSDDFLF